MKGRDADQPDPWPMTPEVTSPPARLGGGSTDIIELGPEERPGPPRNIAAGLALVLIVAAAVGGYLVGSHHHAGPATPTAVPSSSAGPAPAEPIAGTGKRCSVQLNDRLELGIEIVNQSATAATLRQVQAVLPLNGLRATARTWGSCGQLAPAAGDGNYPLPAGATTWSTITFDVLVACPAPLPVLFTVDYTQAGGSGTADLPGFNDLGDVPYSSAKCDN